MSFCNFGNFARLAEVLVCFEVSLSTQVVFLYNIFIKNLLQRINWQIFGKQIVECLSLEGIWQKFYPWPLLAA